MIGTILISLGQYYIDQKREGVNTLCVDFH